MKNLLLLATVPMLAAIGACSGNPNNFFGDDGGNGDDGGTTDDGGSTDDTSSPPPPPSNAPLATGLSISGITVDQAVEINVVKNGAAATPNAPIIAGRRGVVRVFVTTGSGWSSHAITGVLTLHTAGQDHTFTASLAPKSASTDSSYGSTFNFNVDAASFGTDTTFLVQLKDPNGSSPGDSSAQYPKSGSATSLGVKASGPVKIKLIPIHFTAYSAGTPATGGVDVFAYQQIVMSMYPATSVDITVGSTYNYGGSLPQANGSGWDNLLNDIQTLRGSDPSPDVYYYGAFAPTSSFQSFCGYGCVAGLSGIPYSPSDYGQKASIGLVYGGDSMDQQATGQTMAHEVGHGHGREHSPTSSAVQGCTDPNGLDPSYPYANGAIGVWGYNLNASQPVDPTQYFDIMGYCAYDWISDYTYNALYQWVAADNGADMIMPSTPMTYRRIIVHPDGTLELGAAAPVYGTVSGQPRTVTYVDNGVSRTVTGYFTPFDHVKGGTILAPEPAHFTSVLLPDYAKTAITLTH